MAPAAIASPLMHRSPAAEPERGSIDEVEK